MHNPARQISSKALPHLAPAEHPPRQIQATIPLTSVPTKSCDDDVTIATTTRRKLTAMAATMLGTNGGELFQSAGDVSDEGPVSVVNDDVICYGGDTDHRGEDGTSACVGAAWWPEEGDQHQHGKP